MIQIAPMRERPPIVEKDFKRPPISNPAEDQEALFGQSLERGFSEIAPGQMGEQKAGGQD
jgi:hypothetical protein